LFTSFAPEAFRIQAKGENAMSLTKPPEMTPEKLAAVQGNVRRSRGPSHPRDCGAAVRPPFATVFTRVKSMKVCAFWGGDPNEFRNLFRSLVLTWQPVGQFEERLLVQLARAL
jgi:hypothetical protein